MTRFSESVRQGLFTRDGVQYYTTWSALYLGIALLACLVGITHMLPSAIANAAVVTIFGCGAFTFTTVREHPSQYEMRRAKDFTTHIVPLVVAFVFAITLLPRIRHPPVVVSMAMLMTLATLYLLIPNNHGKVGKEKLMESYEDERVNSCVLIIPLLWWLLLVTMRSA